MADLSPDDRDLAIRTMLGEEPSEEGQAGVAAVILNRLAAGSYGGSIGDVVLAPYQFEAWTRQSDQLLAVPRNDPRYVAAGQLFDAVRTGEISDPTNGATHFYAPKAQAELALKDGRPVTPPWAKGQGLRLGSTMFYAPEGRVERKPDAPARSGLAQGLETLGMERQLAETGRQNADVPNRPPAFLKDAAPVQAGAPAQVPNRPPAFLKDAKPVASEAPGFSAKVEEGAGEFSDPVTAEVYRKAHEPLHDRRYPSPPPLPGAFMEPRDTLASSTLDLPIGEQMLAAGAQEAWGMLRAPFDMAQQQLQRIRQGSPVTPEDAGSVAMNAGMLGAREAPGGAAATGLGRAGVAGADAVGEALKEPAPDMRGVLLGPQAVKQALEVPPDPRAAALGKQAVGRAVQREAPPPPPDPRAAAQGRAAVGQALTEPPSGEPTIRLYRGEQAGGQAIVPGSPVTGGWYTTSPMKAGQYGTVKYVDIPISKFARMPQGHLGKDTYISDDPEVRQNLQPFTERTPPGDTRTPEQKLDAWKRQQALAGSPAASPMESPVVGFKTAKGSTYEVHEGGETTRTKSDHTAQGHDLGDVGAKQKSVRTIYVDPRIASALSAAGVSGPEGISWRVAIRDGKASLVSRRGEGPWGVAASSRSIPFSTTPEVGKAPVELWKPSDDVPGHESYRGMHAGNEIVEVTPRVAEPAVPQRPPAFLPADAKPVEPPVAEPPAYVPPAPHERRQIDAPSAQALIDELRKRFGVEKPVPVSVSNRGDFQTLGAMTASWPAETTDAARRAFRMEGVVDPNLGMPRKYAIVVRSDGGHVFSVATLLHEFGHVMQYEKYAAAPAETRAAILAAFEREMRRHGKLSGDVYMAAAHDPIKTTTVRDFETRTQGSLDQDEYQKYNSQFNEWFANQVSTWLTSNREATTLVDKFFKGIADAWRAIYERVAGRQGAAPEIDAFMRGMWDDASVETPKPKALRAAADDPRTIAASRGRMASRVPLLPRDEGTPHDNPVEAWRRERFPRQEYWDKRFSDPSLGPLTPEEIREFEEDVDNGRYETPDPDDTGAGAGEAGSTLDEVNERRRLDEELGGRVGDLGAAVTPPSALLPPAPPEPRIDVVRPVRNFARALRAIFDAPGMGDDARAAAGFIREYRGLSARAAEEGRSALEPFMRQVRELSIDDRLKLIDYIETRTEGGRAWFSKDPTLQPVADALRDVFWRVRSTIEDMPSEARMGFIEDYYPHQWADPKKAGEFIRQWQAKAGEGGFTKKRSIPTLVDGIRAGLVPRTTDPIEAALTYLENAYAFIAHNRIFAEAKDAGFIELATPGQQPEGWARLNGRLADRGFVKAWAPEDFARVYNNALSTIPGPAGDVIQGLRRSFNVITGIELAWPGFHASAMAMEAFANRIASALGDAAHWRLDQAARKAATAPAAPVMTMRRGAEAQQIYRGLTDGSAEMKEVVNLLTRANFRFVGKGRAADEYRFSGADNYFKAIRRGTLLTELNADLKRAGKQPIVGTGAVVLKNIGRAMETMTSPLFEYAIPKLKSGAAVDLMSSWLRNHPEATIEQKMARAREIADVIDDRFGEMNHDNLFWHANLRAGAQMALLSFSWQMGFLRTGVGGAIDWAKFPFTRRQTERMGYLVALPLAIAGVNAAYTYLHTGEAPKGMDFVAARTGGENPDGSPERASIPSWARNVLAWANALGGPKRGAFADELYGMANPGLKDVVDFARNTDWHGDPIFSSAPDAPPWLKQALQSVVERHLPMPLQYGNQGKKGTGTTGLERIFGVRPAPFFVQEPDLYESIYDKKNEREWKAAQKFRERQKALYGQ